MGLSVAAQAPLVEHRRLRQWSGTAGGWLRITLVSFLATLPVEQLRAFPSSLSDCQTPTGWNCSGESHIIRAELRCRSRLCWCSIRCAPIVQVNRLVKPAGLSSIRGQNQSLEELLKQTPHSCYCCFVCVSGKHARVWCLCRGAYRLQIFLHTAKPCDERMQSFWVA